MQFCMQVLPFICVYMYVCVCVCVCVCGMYVMTLQHCGVDPCTLVTTLTITQLYTVPVINDINQHSQEQTFGANCK